MATKEISIRTKDGMAPAHLFPGSGERAKSGIVIYMDAFGVRPAMDRMAERLAAEGYTVLVPDLFYRFGTYGPFDAKTAFADEQTGALIRSEEHTSELQSRENLVCRLLLEKKK